MANRASDLRHTLAAIVRWHGVAKPAISMPIVRVHALSYFSNAQERPLMRRSREMIVNSRRCSDSRLGSVSSSSSESSLVSSAVHSKNSTLRSLVRPELRSNHLLDFRKYNIRS
jgi:hypothetical protein